MSHKRNHFKVHKQFVHFHNVCRICSTKMPQKEHLTLYQILLNKFSLNCYKDFLSYSDENKIYAACKNNDNINDIHKL